MLVVAKKTWAGVHGGSRRSDQIMELLEKTGIPQYEAHPCKAGWAERLEELMLFPKLISDVPPSFRSFGNFRKLWNDMRLLRRNRATAVVVEGMYWSPLVIAASGTVPVVGVPHNIESLVPMQSPWLATTAHEDLAMECKLIARMSHCFCICPEDAAIAGKFCSAIHVLPYYPAADHLNWLLQIRRLREASINSSSSESSPVLVLGTCGNGPTHLGMKQLMDFLATNAINPSLRVVVAGHGTEQFEALNIPGVSVRGRVSDEELSCLMTQARCILVNQFPTSGCLTRITDSLIAGVPVVSNQYGMRGHMLRHGLSGFTELAQGIEFAVTGDLRFPEMPEPPLKSAAEFCEVVRTLHASDKCSIVA